ncbi:MAG TPA: pyruvate dehydrogenase (acetyl-transferring) E1 component subunit alpha, partial [Aigarchaeota archaeon]|nr:pyruvate dehydrogenase (acetyl-transferring) E1 component subunit alpha [Aigarchaeota archaeon]
MVVQQLYKVLSDDGKIITETSYTLSKNKLVEMYQDMVRARLFDEWMLKIHPMGRVSRFPPSIGQEASMIGSIHALEPGDWVFPTYREFPVFLAR